MQTSLGDLGRAEATVESVTAENGARPQDFNLLAWLRLIRGRADDKTLALARRAAEGSQRRSPSILHTLAAALAEADRPEEAYRTLVEEMGARESVLHPEIMDAEWYVIGRIAESYGAVDAAREAYGRYQRPADPAPDDTWHLVDRRLKALPRAAQSPSPAPPSSGKRAATVSAPL